jgi:hypothetical protein
LFYGAFSKPFYCGGEGGILIPAQFTRIANRASVGEDALMVCNFASRKDAQISAKLKARCAEISACGLSVWLNASVLIF